MRKRRRRASPPEQTFLSPALRSFKPPTELLPPWIGCDKRSRNLIDLPSPQLDSTLAAFAILFFKHRNRTNGAPIIDFEFSVLGNFNHPNDLHHWRNRILPHDELDLHVP